MIGVWHGTTTPLDRLRRARGQLADVTRLEEVSGKLGRAGVKIVASDRSDDFCSNGARRLPVLSEAELEELFLVLSCRATDRRGPRSASCCR